jgi:hypothetical protein
MRRSTVLTLSLQIVFPGLDSQRIIEPIGAGSGGGGGGRRVVPHSVTTETYGGCFG